MLICPSCYNALIDDIGRCIHCRAVRPVDGWDVEDHVGTTLLGRYVIERRLGAGATGAVYRAVDRRAAAGTPPEVAVKFLHRRQLTNDSLVARFRREALAASQVEHRGVASTLAYGEQDGGVFLVMEYVDGESLDQRLKREGPQPPGRAAAWGAEIADALSAAHTRGVVHRDLKPVNVWLVPTEDGRDRVKVLDFGYALIQAPEQGAWRVTRTGLIVGSPAYMAPEQTRRDARVDGRTDLYALGVVLYLLLAGHRPLAATSVLSQIRRHRQEVPPTIRRAVPGRAIPRRLDAIVQRLLRKDPADRFQTAAEVASALRALGLANPAASPEPVDTANIPPPLPGEAAADAEGRSRKRAGILAMLRGL